MTKPLFGVALSKLSESLPPDDLRIIAQSKIQVLEVYARMLDDDPQGLKKAALKVMARDGGPRVYSLHAGDRDISALKESEWELAIEESLRGIELAHELGAVQIVIHPSEDRIDPNDRPMRLEQSRRGLLALAPAARRRGIRLAVEMLPRTCLCNTLAEAQGLVGTLPADVFGVCIDTNHLMDNYRVLCDNIVAMAPRLLEVHTSDYDGVDEKHALPGSGVVDWKGVMATLRKVRFSGPMTFEVGFRAQEPLSERIKILEDTFAWLSSL